MRWTTVKKPPEGILKVIIYKPETTKEPGYIDFGLFDHGIWMLRSNSLGDYCRLHADDLPTHWMPAPEYPDLQFRENNFMWMLIIFFTVVSTGEIYAKEIQPYATDAECMAAGRKYIKNYKDKSKELEYTCESRGLNKQWVRN